MLVFFLAFIVGRVEEQALGLTEDRQPTMATTLSRSSSLRAFSAKVGLSLAPSSMTGWILRPSTPPAALISSIAIFSASTSDASAIAIVPESE